MEGRTNSASQSRITALSIAMAVDLPALLWGPPGCGKTSTVESFASASGRDITTIVASVYDPTDFSGLPVQQPDGTVRFAEPSWARQLAGTDGLLFLDEISTATPTVQNALFRVVLERRVGECDLGDDVRIVAAANPVSDNAGSWELSPPLANRFLHLDWHLDAETFVAGLGGRWPAVTPEMVPDGWEALLPLTASAIAGFISVRPELLSSVPTEGPFRGWPSPRSWENACRALAACKAAEVGPEVELLLVEGLVGPGPAIELLSWLSQEDLPAPADLISDPDRHPLPERADALRATLVSLCTLASSGAEAWDAAMRVVLRVAELRPDHAVETARVLARCRPEGSGGIPEGIGALAGVLAEAGQVAA